MSSYNSNPFWDDEDEYEEPEDFYTDSRSDKVDEIISALTEEVRRSISKKLLGELKQLRKENAELLTYKMERNRILVEHNEFEAACNLAIERAKREAEKKRLDLLVKDLMDNVYVISGKHEYIKPKCEKCDNYRYIHFKSPSGCDYKEPCSCAKVGRRFNVVESNVLRMEISATGGLMFYVQECNSGEKVLRLRRSNLVQSESEFDKINFDFYEECKVFFFDKKLAERFAEYLNEKERKEEG